MKRRDFEQHLTRHDCYVRREGANHTIYTNANNGKSSAVPRHSENQDCDGNPHFSRRGAGAMIWVKVRSDSLTG